MARHSSKSDASQGAAVWGAAGLAITVLVALCLLWFWPSRSTPLDETGYDVTIALYRVCNQQSDKGLDQIEAVLSTAGDAGGEPTPQRAAIDSIIRDAREGRWESASRACRQLLDDQADLP